jgi:hypothetical protein
MLEQLYESENPMADRTAVLCSTSWMASKVANYSPAFIAFSFDEDGEAFYKTAQTASQGSTPVLLATMAAPSAPHRYFSTHGLANGTAAWRQDFPGAQILVRFVDTWEQLLWALDQGVDGIISNNAVDIHDAVLTWYKINCSLKNILQYKVIGRGQRER